MVAAGRSGRDELDEQAGSFPRDPPRAQPRVRRDRAPHRNLRGAYLIGANLRGADLRAADLMGADFRGADLGGANLAGSIFLVQSQLDAAKGDLDTRLSPPLTRPTHWPRS